MKRAVYVVRDGALVRIGTAHTETGGSLTVRLDAPPANLRVLWIDAPAKRSRR